LSFLSSGDVMVSRSNGYSGNCPHHRMFFHIGRFSRGQIEK
jgi:hypothetical protein